ncbi:MAG: isoprenylcysteine carboxylmethyltransferase family protein, partial [Gemmatimonadetes bacterium]|nr:isoprenylcysteine carboxylmethyltransferase family protein [Gemmatimonadota bacterium]
MNTWPSKHFDRLNTTVKPFEEPRELTTAGLFGFTRNPMYLGGVVLLAGLAIFLGSLSPWPVIPVFMWVIARRFISAEEEILERRFGERYLEYKARVRRWL